MCIYDVSIYNTMAVNHVANIFASSKWKYADWNFITETYMNLLLEFLCKIM